MIEYATEQADSDYPPQQFFIVCQRCGTRTFRFDSPQATEMNWATMDGHAVEYSRESRRAVA
jgi:hypothetical protein